MYRFNPLVSISAKLSLRNYNAQVVEALAGGGNDGVWNACLATGELYWNKPHGRTVFVLI